MEAFPQGGGWSGAPASSEAGPCTPRKPKAAARSGEKLPVAKIPAGVAYKPGQENRADQSFDLAAPVHAGTIRNLVTGKDVPPGSAAKVGPRTTVVLHFR